MGHIRLGVLPKSKKWNRVVEELRLGADVSEIASATAAAAETSLENASSDPIFLHAFWLLTQIPLAARGPEFIEDLRQLGITVSVQPGLMDLLAGFSAAVDQNARARGGRTDLGEVAQMAAVESLAALVGPMSNSIELGPRIGVQKVPLLAGRNDSARPRRSWSGLRSRGERGGVGGGFER